MTSISGGSDLKQLLHLLDNPDAIKAHVADIEARQQKISESALRAAEEHKQQMSELQAAKNLLEPMQAALDKRKAEIAKQIVDLDLKLRQNQTEFAQIAALRERLEKDRSEHSANVATILRREERIRIVEQNLQAKSTMLNTRESEIRKRENEIAIQVDAIRQIAKK